MDLLTAAIPAFIILMLIEWAFGLAVGRNTYRLNDTINSLSMGSIRTLGKLVFFDLSIRLFTQIAELMAWAQWPSHWLTWVIGFVAYDFFYYWFHRISHERSIFWASHVAHHQSEEFNLSTALRQTGTGFICSWVFFIPLFFLGCPPELFYTIAAVNLLYQFWVHSEHIPKLGWFEWGFVTASNHRVHHACNTDYLDRNYGGVFIVWDRMFGTFKEESARLPCVYGISQPLHSWNPLWANAHVYLDIGRAAIRQADWRKSLACLWLAPAELKKVERNGSDVKPGVLKSPERITAAGATEAAVKFDPVIDAPVKAYIAVQFLLLLILASYLSFAGPQLPTHWLWSGFALVVLGYTSVGLLMEGRAWGYRLETLRLVMNLAALPALSGADVSAMLLASVGLTAVCSLFWLSALLRGRSAQVV